MNASGTATRQLQRGEHDRAEQGEPSDRDSCAHGCDANARRRWVTVLQGRPSDDGPVEIVFLALALGDWEMLNTFLRTSRDPSTPEGKRPRNRGEGVSIEPWTRL